jgi:hypothetical protein
MQFFCRQDALYLCYSHAATARDRGQRWAVACLGARGSSIYPVGAEKDPCISFLESLSNSFHIHLHVICHSQWPCGLRRGSVAARLLEGLWIRIPTGNECMSLVSVVCCQVEHLDRATHSSWGVLLNVLCLSVIPKPQQWGGLGPLVLCSHEKLALNLIKLINVDTVNLW